MTLATEATAVVLNLPLAEAVLEQITAHPELHTQASHWGFRNECGTTLCISGWALALTPGTTFVWRPWTNGEDLLVVLLPGSDTPWDPEDAGRKVLGLDAETASHLFLDLEDEAAAVAELRRLIAAAKQVTA